MEYKLTRAQVAHIHSIACSEWQGRITNWVKKQDLFADTLTFTKDEVQRMFDAAGNHNGIDQRAELKKLFPDFVKDSTDKIQSYEDVEKILGDEIIEFNLKINAAREEHTKVSNSMAALCKIYNIAAAYNKLKNVTLDWKNTSQYKYFSYYDFSDGGLLCFWRYGADSPTGVAFANREDLLDAQSKFKQIFLDFHMA